MVAGFLAGMMASLFELKHLVDMMSIGTLMAYTIVAVAVIVLRYRPHDSSSNGDYIALSVNKKLLQDSDDDSESDQELLYSRDDNPVLPTAGVEHDPASSLLEHDQTDTFLKILLCPWSSKTKAASNVSASVANVLTMTSALASFILALVLITDTPMRAAFSTILSSSIAFCTVWTWLLPTDNQNLTFQVPLVPLLPNVSIFINLYLMLKLSAATWVRFTVWMSVGAFIYLFYGWSHSTEEKRNRS